MNGIPEVEPIAIFPTKEVLDKNASSEAMRQWLLENADSFRAALCALSVEIEARFSRINILRESETGEAFMVSLDLYGYNPGLHKLGAGRISLRAAYRESFGGDFITSGHEAGEHGTIEFEQLDILPEGLGLRLRRKISNPNTITHIDALGNLTTRTESPLKS